MAGGYAHQPQGIEAIVAEFRKIRKMQDDLSRRITSLGITIDPAGNLIFGAAGKDVIIKGGSGLDIQDDGTLHVAGATTLDGDLTATAGTLKSGNYVAGSAGWQLQPSGNVEINDLTLRGGIIGNDALANPVRPATAHNDAAGYSLTTTATEKARVTIPVPSGFSQALVMGSINATAKNTSAAQDFLDGYVDIIGVNPGWDSLSDGPANASIGIANVSTALLTGLGSTFYVRAMLRSGSASWTADSINSVNVDALVLFLR